MYQKHFTTIHSTQLYLRENLLPLRKYGKDILISASKQTGGFGRNDHRWESYENSLAMSFTIKPHTIPTLTPLEVGILVSDFVKQNFKSQIFLKWPNDLLTENGLKCGGILSQFIDQTTVIVGLGINIGRLPEVSPTANFKHGIGSIHNHMQLNSEDQKKLSSELYSFILSHRLKNQNDVQNRFYQLCYHLGKSIVIEDHGNLTEGKFIGIGPHGEALLVINEKTKSFLSGSLTILS